MAGDILDNPIETPVGDVPIIPVTLMVFGGYLAWFGVHYWGSDTKWPTDPIKAILTGKPIPTPDTSARKNALTAIQGAAASSASGTTVQGPFKGGTLTNIPAGQQTLNHQQLEDLWTSNGGSPGAANVAAAVAEAESSGRTWITSPNPDGGTNVGPWQLDTKGVGTGYTVEQLQDPVTNVRVTIMGSANGSNWSHWETFVNGDYKKFLA